MEERTKFPQLDSITPYINTGDTLLEIGCSYGYGLNYLKNYSSCECFGIEPSGKAIDYGNKKYPGIILEKGTGINAKLLSKKYNHVILGFCLYLTDDNLLLQTLVNVDKALLNGGFVHIYDFDVKQNIESEYGHDNRIKVFKRNYSNIMTKFGDYFLVSKKPWSHEGDGFHKEKHERCASYTFYKEL